MPTTTRGASFGLIAPLRDVPRADTQLRILVLGGTSFLGVHQVNYALARGHRVTLFNRGQPTRSYSPKSKNSVEIATTTSPRSKHVSGTSS